MANFIYSRVNIEPEEAMDKIYNMIESMPQSEYGKETTDIVKTFYTEQELNKPYNNGETEYPINDNGVNIGWLYDNVGTKWISLGLEDDIRIESPSYIPDGFLIKLYSICIEEFNDVKLTCEWYDETETNCGTAVIWNGIYTEDEETILDEDIYDAGYQPTGDEDIDEVREWILSEINEDTYLTEDELNSMDAEEVRELFEDWKNQSKWDYINDAQNKMLGFCEKAIESLNFDYPIRKVQKIADGNKIIENCYPF